MKKKITAFVASLTLTGVVFGSSLAEAASYEVKQGDTLWGIAQKHKTSVSNLYKVNKLKSDMIFPNQVLEIDGQKEQEKNSEKVDKYKVVSGDSLWKIAEKYKVTVAKLKDWNKLTSDVIHPGNVLAINGTVESSNQSAEKKPVENTSTETKAEATKAPVQEQKQEQTSGQEITVEATAYTAYCEGCSGITSTGLDLRSNPNQKVIAVDPSVIPLGSKVYVEGYGEAIAGDTGGAIKGNRIDVFIPEKSQALNWGRKSVKVKVLN